MVKIAALLFRVIVVACIVRDVEVAVKTVSKIVAWPVTVAVVAWNADHRPVMVA